MTVLTETKSEMLKFAADGTFQCVECRNNIKVQVNSEEGLVDADLAKVKTELSEHPEKLMFGTCPVCGMEYQFMLVDKQAAEGEEQPAAQPEGKQSEKELVVKPSDEEK